jgi:hypothetical protein
LFGSADFHFPILAVDALLDAVELALDDSSVVIVVLFAQSTHFGLVLAFNTLLNRSLDVASVDRSLKLNIFVLPLFPLGAGSVPAVRVSIKALLF